MTQTFGPILQWRFEDAPEEYKVLSHHHGQEEWLAFIPSSWPFFPDFFDPIAPRIDPWTVRHIKWDEEHAVEGGTVLIFLRPTIIPTPPVAKTVS